MNGLRIRQLALVAAATTLLGACNTPREELTPRVDQEASRADTRRQYPDLSYGMYGTWLEIAKGIPGYGGHFLRDGAIWVYLLNPEAQRQRAKGLFLGNGWRAWSSTGVRPTAVRTLKARYSAVDLMRWHSAMHALIGPGDIYGVGLGFDTNQVALYVNPGTDRAMVERRIRALDVPLAAVRIVERELPPAL